jgi:hypothetical protein
MNPIFYGQIKEGKIILDTPLKYVTYKAELEGKRVELILRRKKSQRSIEQNKAYWGIIIEILCAHTGYDKEQMHFALKEKFASHLDEKTGLRIVESTAKMDTKRFSKYYEDIQKWSAEFLHCYLPSPNEIEFDNIA